MNKKFLVDIGYRHKFPSQPKRLKNFFLAFFQQKVKKEKKVLKPEFQTIKSSFIHFQVLSLEKSQQECQGSLIWNPIEAKFVASLAKFVARDLVKRGHNQTSIGILTFYNKQKNMIRNALQDLNVPLTEDFKQQQGTKSGEADSIPVSVRSVDGFQVRFDFFNRFIVVLRYFKCAEKCPKIIKNSAF